MTPKGRAAWYISKVKETLEDAIIRAWDEKHEGITRSYAEKLLRELFTDEMGVIALTGVIFLVDDIYLELRCINCTGARHEHVSDSEKCLFASTTYRSGPHHIDFVIPFRINPNLELIGYLDGEYEVLGVLPDAVESPRRARPILEGVNC